MEPQSREHFQNNSLGVPSEDIEEKIQQCIQQSMISIKENYPANSDFSLEADGRKDTDHTLYTGYGGNLFLYWRLKDYSESYNEDLKVSCEAVISKLSELRDESPSTFMIGRAGIFCMLAVILKDERYVRMTLHDIKDSNTEFELLYGAVGSLYCLGFILKYFPGTEHFNEIVRKIQNISEDIINKANVKRELLFKFPSKSGKKYLGAAHGIIGIVHILMQLREFLPNYEIVIKATIELILKFQFKSGNFAIHDESKSDDTVHFCHGGPGAVPMLCLAYQIYNESRYLQSAIRAADDIWRRGLLLKGRGICHGAAGNGYAFLSLFTATGEDIWLNRALVFAEIMGFDTNYDQAVRNFDDPQRIAVGIADHPFSLMEGNAGTVCYFLDCLNPMSALFPAYDI